MLRKFGSTGVAFFVVLGFVVLGILAGIIIYLAISSSRATVIKDKLVEAPSPSIIPTSAPAAKLIAAQGAYTLEPVAGATPIAGMRISVTPVKVGDLSNAMFAMVAVYQLPGDVFVSVVVQESGVVFPESLSFYAKLIIF